MMFGEDGAINAAMLEIIKDQGGAATWEVIFQAMRERGLIPPTWGPADEGLDPLDGVGLKKAGRRRSGR